LKNLKTLFETICLVPNLIVKHDVFCHQNLNVRHMPENLHPCKQIKVFINDKNREPDNWSHGHLIPCHFCQTGRLVPSSFARLDIWSHPISDKEDYWSHHISSHLSFTYLHICLTIVLFIYLKLIKRYSQKFYLILF